MSFINIRLAEIKDLNSIEIIENTCFEKNRRSSRHSLEHSIKSQYQLVVLAEQKYGFNTSVTGAMILYMRKYSLRIFSIGVLPEYQNAGIGFKFLQYAKSVACERGLSSITLEVDMQNVKLVNWYIKHGFMDMNQVLIDYYGQGEHALRLKQLISYSDIKDHKSLDKLLALQLKNVQKMEIN
jgi:ribosomal protein S18 acetylase RimI-like enzyme